MHTPTGYFRTFNRNAALTLLFLIVGLLAAQGTTWDHKTWPPPTSTADVPATVPVSASVVVSPPSITLNFIVAGKYQIFRKDPGATTWGTAQVTLSSDLNTWTDKNVNVGQLYEYKIIYTDGPTESQVPNPQTYVGGSSPPIGYILTGINVDETQPRGRIIVVVASDVPTNLPTEYNEYLSDLRADGWFVHVISVAPGGYDVGGANALATVTVTNGGSGYVATSVPASNIFSTTNGTNDFSFTDTVTGSVAFGTITLSSGTTSISAVAIASGGNGGGFNVGDPLTIGQVASGTGSGATFKVATVTPSSSLPNPAPIRAAIQAIYNQYPGEVKELVLLGKVPACRTGSKLIGDPDGHEVNDGATGADGYYANMTGTWTDTGSNASYFNQDGITLITGEVNTPNDNKFDQYYMSQSGGQADLNFGRIDLANNIAGQYEALKYYIQKLHRYKTASPDFQPGRRIVLRTGAFPNIDETCWTMATGVVPPTNTAGVITYPKIDCISSSELPTEVSANFDADADYSGTHGPYLFYYKGNGGPGIGVGGKAVFWTGMQSHWGWWYSSTVSSGENSEALRLAENSFGLSWTWDIFGTRYFYHRMSMGFDAGDMMRVSVNNVDAVNGTYANTTDVNGWSYIAPCAGALFMNHIGDPTLRFFMFPPPTNLSVVPVAGQPSLTWTASVPMLDSTEPSVMGYHVYRAPITAGAVSAPYTRITTSLVTGTTYTDTDPAAGSGTGQWSYMVKAVRLETTGSGTYYNASLGSIQSIDQTNPAATLTISSPATLPDCNWNTAYATVLSATGGTPNYSWTVISGTIPPGLTLNANGSFSGLPTTAGTYTFTAKATDALNQTAQQAFTLTTESNNVVTLLPEATAYTISSAATRVQGPTETMLVGPGNFSFLRFNVASLNTNNTLVSAKLRVYTASGTSLTTNSLMESGLTPDATVNWSMATLCWNNQPSDNPAVPAAYAPGFPSSLAYTDIDVTQEFAYALANNTTGKFGVRLFTQASGVTTLCSGYSYGGAIPQLIIQTSNAPKISFTTPTTNPAVVYVGSGVQLSATITPIPANAASLTQQWSMVSGPGTVTFGTPTLTSTTATFSAPGDYIVQLAANDSVLQSTKTVTVRVISAPVNGPIDSMTLHLPFSESSGTTTSDTSGSGNNGTTYGGATFSTAGLVGNALSVNGSQGVTITDSAANPNPIDGQQAISISMWVNPTTLLTDASFVTLISKSGAFQIQIRQQTNGGQVFNSIAGITSQQSGKRLTAGTWTNIIAVFNGANTTGDTLQLYINGVPDVFTTSATSSVLRKSTVSTFIGGLSATDTHGFIGLIDELRIYKRALSLAEIEDIAAGVPTNTGPVITTNTSLTGASGQSLPLTATVLDDGKPAPGTLTYNWSELSGPSVLTIPNPGSLNTSTTPNSGGAYNLLFTANDGAITTFANIGAAITGPAQVTYASWAAQNGLTGPGAAQSAITAQDGLNNLYKYALGLAPTTNYNPGATGLPYVTSQNIAGTNYLTLTFNGVATDVTYQVQATNDLNGSWTPIQTFKSGSAAPGLVTVQDTQAVTVSPKRYMRLVMTIP